MTPSPEEQASDLLLRASTAVQALRSLYDLAKERRKSLSLSVFCKRAGIAAKSHLSDVFAAKQLLSLKYGPGVAAALNLEGHGRRLFLLLLERDHEREPSRREQLDDKIEAARKVLSFAFRVMKPKMAEMFFSLEVFCAFGLFGNEPTRAELSTCFGAHRTADVLRAIHLLESLKIIAADGEDETAKLRLITDRLFFLGSEDGISHLDFLRLALQDAVEKAPQWFERRDRAHFESSVISVREDAFVKLLPTIKNDLLQLQSTLETGDADLLLRFNVQIYPANETAAR